MARQYGIPVDAGLAAASRWQRLARREDRRQRGGAWAGRHEIGREHLDGPARRGARTSSGCADASRHLPRAGHPTTRRSGHLRSRRSIERADRRLTIERALASPLMPIDGLLSRSIPDRVEDAAQAAPATALATVEPARADRFGRSPATSGPATPHGTSCSGRSAAATSRARGRGRPGRDATGPRPSRPSCRRACWCSMR